MTFKRVRIGSVFHVGPAQVPYRKICGNGAVTTTDYNDDELGFASDALVFVTSLDDILAEDAPDPDTYFTVPWLD